MCWDLVPESQFVQTLSATRLFICVEVAAIFHPVFLYSCINSTILLSCVPPFQQSGYESLWISLAFPAISPSSACATLQKFNLCGTFVTSATLGSTTYLAALVSFVTFIWLVHHHFCHPHIVYLNFTQPAFLCPS